MHTDQDDPTPQDWLAIGNDLRTVLGLAPLGSTDRCPTDEELAEYDKVRPGLADQLRQMAREEHRHRLELEAMEAQIGAYPAWTNLLSLFPWFTRSS